MDFQKKIVLWLLLKYAENCDVWLKQDENNTHCVNIYIHFCLVFIVETVYCL